MANAEQQPLVGVVMGSDSDLEFMGEALDVLDKLGIPHELGFTSAHRTPDLMDEYGETAVARGLKVVIAGAGGSAHLPGMMASKTLLPVKGVAIGRSPGEIQAAIDSMIYMPKGVDLDFMGVNTTGAHNAALGAVRILALLDAAVAARSIERKEHMGDTVRAKNALVQEIGGKTYREAMVQPGKIDQLLAGRQQ
jgi:5-(carboxyamino)imidazole ribonucleotide mutase